MATYRERKEHFVSNLNGTTLFETGSVVINICASYFLCQVVKSRFPLPTHSFSNFLFEHVVLIVPMTLVSTILSPFSAIVHLVLWFIAFGIYFLVPANASTPIDERPRHSQSYSRIIEVFRGQVFLVTYLCILAVDFPIFPRRYAKTENTGYSGMDMGVGLFALAHGMVSSEARNKSTRWREFLLENSILFVLGVVRLISVKYVSYIEHVSEYGVHWNFFLTLCLMKSIGVLLLRLTKNLPVLIVCVAVGHEVILLRLLQYDQYLIDSAALRETFVDANREGIFSLGGYVTLYLIGILLGRFVIDNERQRRFSFMSAVLLAAMLVLCLISSDASRKLCNISYISSTTGLACMCLGSFSGIQWLLSRQRYPTESILLKNVNQKGLDTFLLANVFTGIINLTVDTIDTSYFSALVIVLSYMFIVSACAYFSPSILKLMIAPLKSTK